MCLRHPQATKTPSSEEKKMKKGNVFALAEPKTINRLITGRVTDKDTVLKIVSWEFWAFHSLCSFLRN